MPVRSNNKVFICSNNSAGILLFRMELTSLFIKRGWQPYLLLPFDSPEHLQRLQEHGCVCIDLPFSRRGLNPFALMWLWLRYCYYLLRVRPQLTLTYTIKPALCANLAARLLGIPHAAVITGLGQGFSSTSKLARLLSWAYQIALKRARAVFFLNTGNQDFFLRRHLVRASQCCLLAGEGVNLQQYPAAPPANNSPPIFLLVARLLRAKGIAEFAEASRLLRADNFSLRCQLLGPPDEGDDAISTQQIDQWQQDGLLEYLGASDSGIYNYLCAADCLLLPSYFEGMSRVLMEAAATARPIITSDVAGCRELVEAGYNGWLCPPADARALARAMMQFLQTSPEQRAQMGLNSRAKLIADGFDADKVAHRMYQILTREFC